MRICPDVGCCLLLYCDYQSVLLIGNKVLSSNTHLDSAALNYFQEKFSVAGDHFQSQLHRPLCHTVCFSSS